MASIINHGYADAEPGLDQSRHVKYWTRCIKTFLPSQYTSTDSNRMYLAFLMICALDLLNSLTTVCTPEERHDYANWIYRCQHPDGGFRMWPGTDFGERADEVNAKWDPANVPGTYFALAALLILGDDLKRVRRRLTLRWLRGMQRSDGSFGETLVDGRTEGGKDPRFAYCATGIRYMLRGGAKDGSLMVGNQEVEDVDLDALVSSIRNAESFDGGISDEYLHEPHAGYTFCSVGALSFADRLNTEDVSGNDPKRAPSNPQDVVRWLVHRQTDLLDPDASLDSEFVGSSKHAATNMKSDLEPLYQTPAQTLLHTFQDLSTSCAGMNGRTNKVADTCYAWWAGASLHLLGHPTLYDQTAVRKYLLEKTQHPVLGGFGKFPGDLPDIYHSCLGLAALSLAGSREVKPFDAGMCVSSDARARLERLWQAWERDGEGGG